MASLQNEPSFELDKLSYEIFSILESKFLFGYDDSKHWLQNLAGKSPEKFTAEKPREIDQKGKVCILSIDGGATNGVFAGKALEHLERSLKMKSGDPSARIADFFDVGAGSGVGGVFTAMLFARNEEDRPLSLAEDTWKLLMGKGRKILGIPAGIFRRPANAADKIFRRVFGDLTLRDTLKPILIPCYDLSSEAPFLFSRADALETDGYDFKLWQVCRATSANPAVFRPVRIESVDGRTRCVAVDGGIVMSNPTAAAITHVLNNKQEFPFSVGVEDLLVLSLGNGEGSSGDRGRRDLTPSTSQLVRIAGDGISDMFCMILDQACNQTRSLHDPGYVGNWNQASKRKNKDNVVPSRKVDQSVSMAFGQNRTNYVRIQANGLNTARSPAKVGSKSGSIHRLLETAKDMLTQKNVESVLFQGKKFTGETNAAKLDWFAGELVKEHQRRKTRALPTVVLKQATPRTSSATIASS